MSTPIIQNLEKLLDTPRDGALLRYGLGNEWLKAGDMEKAALHLREAVRRDPTHSAAWKLLGKSLAAEAQTEAALEAYRQGIATATQKGDVQAAKEMTVFAKRLEKQLAAAAPTPTGQ